LIETPGDCGNWQTPAKLSGEKIDHALDQVVAAPRPGLADRLVTDVVSHGRGARREDRHVSATLADQAQLVVLDRLTDLVIADVGIGRINVASGLEGRGLGLTPSVVSARRGRIVAVAVDDHRETLRWSGRWDRGPFGPARLSIYQALAPRPL
jgi:hypothetical protein